MNTYILSFRAGELMVYYIIQMEDNAEKRPEPEECTSEDEKKPGKFFNPKRGLNTILRKVQRIVRCLKKRGKVASSYSPIMLAVIRELVDALCLPAN